MQNFRRDSKRRWNFAIRNIFYFEPAALPLEDEVFGKINAEIIRECIEELPDEYAKHLRLLADPYMTPEILAGILEVKPSSLHMIRTRARRLLKEACDAKGAEVAAGAGRKKE